MHKPLDDNKKAYFHLPGLFEFYELYKIFLPLFRDHREYFYDWCEIGSIYGAPADCLWGGGRVEGKNQDASQVFALTDAFGISARLTFSNSLLTEESLSDKKCNRLCRQLSRSGKNGVIVYSDLLLEYLQENYPDLYFVSSTTKVLTNWKDFTAELDRDSFRYVVPDFRLNKQFEKLKALPNFQKNKIEFLCNECCDFSCTDRKECYKDVSRMNLGVIASPHICPHLNSNSGYSFAKAMENPGFISTDQIINIYMPMGFSNFKLEGRGLGSAMVLEFLLYYMVKPQYQIHVREALYLDCMLDLF